MTAELVIVAAMEMTAAATEAMAAPTAAKASPTAAEAAADAAAAEVECDMNQRVGVFEDGSMLTQILDFCNFWRQKK